MKKFNFTISAFLYSFLVYCFYLVVYIFVKRSGYENGIYLFTPAFIFTFFKMISNKLWKKPVVILFVMIPFVMSAYLSLNNGVAAGWEVSGIIPIFVLASFLFKSGEKPATPLENILMTKICVMILLSVLFFSSVHFFRTGDINSAVYLAVSVYSPAPVLLALAIFVNFIISTAAVSIVLNNLKLFNMGGKIKRLVFDTDDFLTLPHLNLSGIVTVTGVSKNDFLEKVEKLNEAARQSKEYAKQLKQNKLFSKKFKEEGYTLAMAPVNVMVESGNYDVSGIPLPETDDKRSFIALAMDSTIIGYYAIDRITPETNSDMLKVIKENFNIPSIVVNPSDISLWGNCCSCVEKFDELEMLPEDMIISSAISESDSILASWGEKDKEKIKGDVFIAKPFLSSILNLMIITHSIPQKFYKGIIIVSLPFAFPLFTVSMGLKIPQVSAASTMFSLVFTIFYVFYVKKRKKDSGGV